MYQTPNAEDVISDTCLILRFPGSVAFKSRVKGALASLVFESAWELDGDLSPEDTAQIFKIMMLNAEYRCMIGSIMPFAGENVPQWALLCDGSTHSKDDYPALWDMIDPAFKSGDDIVLPDMVNRTVVGAKADEEGLYDVGDTGGETSHLLTIAEMPEHGHANSPHSHTDLGHSHFYSAPGTLLPVIAPGEAPSTAVNLLPGTTSTGFASITSDSITIDTNGGDEQHNNMPPYIALKWIIVAR